MFHACLSFFFPFSVYCLLCVSLAASFTATHFQTCLGKKEADEQWGEIFVKTSLSVTQSHFSLTWLLILWSPFLFTGDNIHSQTCICYSTSKRPPQKGITAHTFLVTFCEWNRIHICLPFHQFLCFFLKRRSDFRAVGKWPAARGGQWNKSLLHPWELAVSNSDCQLKRKLV